MEAVNAVIEGPPPPSPLTGCYLLVVLGEPNTAPHKDVILQRLAKGLLSWNVNDCLVDLEKELTTVVGEGIDGEEARYGERLIQFASENLVTEILIHPSVSTLAQCVRNLLSSFTRHRHIIHAGYTFAANGSWVLQDGTFSIQDFAEAFQENDVQRVIHAYGNGISVDIHCSSEGDWSRLPKESFTRGCRVRVNPNDVLDSGSEAITSFVKYIAPFLVPSELENVLESSDIVGNIRFSRPTLYVFPGGQGDAALFGINGFNMLVDGGFSRKSCFWDFVRHLDRLDAVLLTRLNNGNVNGISAVLKRKALNAIYPQIGHFFSNVQSRTAILSPDGDKDKDPLLINLLEEGQDMITNLRSLDLYPQSCYRDSEPINLYHKVGHGTLDMYILNPARDTREVKEFLLRWNNNDHKLFANHRFSRECMLPLQNIVSICALLVWRPANPNDTITRILFPGSAPQGKIFEGLEKIKHLECIKHAVCTEKSLSLPHKPKSKDNILDRSSSAEKQKTDIKKNKVKQSLQNKNIENNLKNNLQQSHTEKQVMKSGSIDSDKSDSKVSKTRKEEVKIIEDNKQERQKISSRPKSELNVARPKYKALDKKPRHTVENKGDIEMNVNRRTTRISPSTTPAKSTKDANNKKVLESKSKLISRSTVNEAKQQEKRDEMKKIEKKSGSRRPRKDISNLPKSPAKKLHNGRHIDLKKGKIEKDVATDSSSVSTPSIDQDSLPKKEISKLTPEELQQMNEQADLEDEKEAMKELEAVFGNENKSEEPLEHKMTDISIDDRTEPEEYLIIEKEITEQCLGADLEVKEEETVKLARDSEESEKKKDAKDEIYADRDKQVDTEQEESGIGEQETDVEEGEEIRTDFIKDASIFSQNGNRKISKEEEMKEAGNSQPDEKVSANIESGATTTAPTLPEDERIPLNEIKEDQVDQIEEKHMKEETREKETKEEQDNFGTSKSHENFMKSPAVIGICLDKETRIRDIVKTPDEVADLPVHEEADVEQLVEFAYDGDKSKTAVHDIALQEIDRNFDKMKNDDASGNLIGTEKGIQEEVKPTAEKKIEILENETQISPAEKPHQIEQEESPLEQSSKQLNGEKLVRETRVEGPDTVNETDKEEQEAIHSGLPSSGKQDERKDAEEETSHIKSEKHQDLVCSPIKKEEAASNVSNELNEKKDESVCDDKIEGSDEIVVKNISSHDDVVCEKGRNDTKIEEASVDNRNLLVENPPSTNQKNVMEEAENASLQNGLETEPPILNTKKETVFDQTETNLKSLESSPNQVEITDNLSNGVNSEGKEKIPTPKLQDSELQEVLHSPIPKDLEGNQKEELERNAEDTIPQKETASKTPVSDISEKNSLASEDSQQEGVPTQNIDNLSEKTSNGNVGKEGQSRQLDQNSLPIETLSEDINLNREQAAEKEKAVDQEKKKLTISDDNTQNVEVKEKISMTEVKEERVEKSPPEENSTFVESKVVEEAIVPSTKRESITGDAQLPSNILFDKTEKVTTKVETEVDKVFQNGSEVCDKIEIEDNGKAPQFKQKERSEDQVLHDTEEKYAEPSKPSKEEMHSNDAVLQETQKEEVRTLVTEEFKSKMNVGDDIEHSEIDSNEHIKIENIRIDISSKPEHAEAVVLESTPESPVINNIPSLPLDPRDTDRIELGRKSPKEREEDVAKIVVSVAAVLKSDAPLEKFTAHGGFTTELRETHITTSDSPRAGDSDEDEFEDDVLLRNKIESIPTNDQIEVSVDKIEDLDDSSTVHRMLVTASSEDGGEETEICPVGTIIFPRSSESSDRSSPDNITTKPSESSSIIDTLDQLVTVVGVGKDIQTKNETVIDTLVNSEDSTVHNHVEIAQPTKATKDENTTLRQTDQSPTASLADEQLSKPQAPEDQSKLTSPHIELKTTKLPEEQPTLEEADSQTLTHEIKKKEELSESNAQSSKANGVDAESTILTSEDRLQTQDHRDEQPSKVSVGVSQVSKITSDLPAQSLDDQNQKSETIHSANLIENGSVVPKKAEADIQDLSKSEDIKDLSISPKSSTTSSQITDIETSVTKNLDKSPIKTNEQSPEINEISSGKNVAISEEVDEPKQKLSYETFMDTITSTTSIIGDSLEKSYESAVKKLESAADESVVSLQKQVDQVEKIVDEAHSKTSSFLESKLDVLTDMATNSLRNLSSTEAIEERMQNLTENVVNLLSDVENANESQEKDEPKNIYQTTMEELSNVHQQTSSEVEGVKSENVHSSLVDAKCYKDISSFKEKTTSDSEPEPRAVLVEANEKVEKMTQDHELSTHSIDGLKGGLEKELMKDNDIERNITEKEETECAVKHDKHVGQEELNLKSQEETANAEEPALNKEIIEKKTELSTVDKGEAQAEHKKIKSEIPKDGKTEQTKELQQDIVESLSSAISCLKDDVEHILTSIGSDVIEVLNEYSDKASQEIETKLSTPVSTKTDLIVDSEKEIEKEISKYEEAVKKGKEEFCQKIESDIATIKENTVGNKGIIEEVATELKHKFDTIISSDKLGKEFEEDKNEMPGKTTKLDDRIETNEKSITNIANIEEKAVENKGIIEEAATQLKHKFDSTFSTDELGKEYKVDESKKSDETTKLNDRIETNEGSKSDNANIEEQTVESKAKIEEVATELKHKFDTSISSNELGKEFEDKSKKHDETTKLDDRIETNEKSKSDIVNIEEQTVESKGKIEEVATELKHKVETTISSNDLGKEFEEDKSKRHDQTTKFDDRIETNKESKSDIATIEENTVEGKKIIEEAATELKHKFDTTFTPELGKEFEEDKSQMPDKTTKLNDRVETDQKIESDIADIRKKSVENMEMNKEVATELIHEFDTTINSHDKEFDKDKSKIHDKTAKLNERVETGSLSPKKVEVMATNDKPEFSDIRKDDGQTLLDVAVSSEKKLSISDVNITIDMEAKNAQSTPVDSKIDSSSSEPDKHITSTKDSSLQGASVMAGKPDVGIDDSNQVPKPSVKMDPMSMSFYESLPDDDELADVCKDEKQSHLPTQHQESKKPSSAEKYQQESDEGNEAKARFIIPTYDPMTSSVFGELPMEKEQEDTVESWGKPLKLPNPVPPNDKGTPKKERKLPSNVMAKNKINDDKALSDSPPKNRNRSSPIYVDLTYVPHHGNANYTFVDFFKKIRARYYVFSGVEPSREVLNALLEAKQSWENPDLEVTIIPTYDTDVLGYWVAENEELLAKHKIDLSPSASRCTINLQDHETSCSAYRLEF